MKIKTLRIFYRRGSNLRPQRKKRVSIFISLFKMNVEFFQLFISKLFHFHYFIFFLYISYKSSSVYYLFIYLFIKLFNLF